MTDPMCSWCWGMSGVVEEAAHQLAGVVEFDFLLGGINTHGTQPIGDFGRRHLLKIWREVNTVTGQPFAFELPDPCIYNSTLACVAVEALRRRAGKPPFGFLHRLQQALFVEGANITDGPTLARVAQEFGWAANELLAELEDPELHALVARQFDTSRDYGTNALPSVLLEQHGQRVLVLGGYVDSTTLTQTLRTRAGIT